MEIIHCCQHFTPLSIFPDFSFLDPYFTPYVLMLRPGLHWTFFNRIMDNNFENIVNEQIWNMSFVLVAFFCYYVFLVTKVFTPKRRWQRGVAPVLEAPGKTTWAQLLLSSRLTLFSLLRFISKSSWVENETKQFSKAVNLSRSIY